MSKTLINDQWLEYAATTFALPPGQPPPPARLLEVAKKAFFAGAFTVYSLQVQCLKKGDDAAFHALMNTMEAEFGRLIREMQGRQ